MTKQKTPSLRLRSDIDTSYRTELKRIDGEVKRLREQRKELRKIMLQVRTMGRRANLLMDQKSPFAARDFIGVEKDAIAAKQRILDLRGPCDLWHSLHYRDIDMWVTRGAHPLD